MTMASCATVAVAVTLALRVAVAVVCLWQHRSMVRDVGGSLLEVEVGSGSEWRDAQHPLRCAAHLRCPAAQTHTITAWWMNRLAV